MGGFVERKLENLAWETKGQKIVGRLIAVTTVQYRDNKGLSYKFRRSDGVMVIFNGATDLNYKLERGDIGADVSIEYLGEDESKSVSEGRSRPKMFKVMVDKSVQPAPPAAAATAGDPGITDADIPF